MSRWTSPRALGLGGVALVLIVSMTALGLWQLAVFDERQEQAGTERLEQPAVPLSGVMGPDDAYPGGAVGLPVTVSGRYVAGEQVYVEGLPGHDHTYAVVTPLVDASGSAILVVRGASDTRDVAAPGGVVSVEGVLEPSTATGGPVDTDRVTDGIRVPALVEDFGQDLYSGYLVLRSSEPAETLPPVEPPTPEPSLLTGLRNLAYALQWWVFAAFVGFMWWRIVREHDDESEDRQPEPVG